MGGFLIVLPQRGQANSVRKFNVMSSR